MHPGNYLVCTGAFLAAIIFVTFSGTAGAMIISSPYMSCMRNISVTEPVQVQLNGEIAEGARNYIENMGNRAIAFLSDASLTQKQRKREFKTLLEDSFDLKTIGRFAIGSNWRKASPQQRKEYQNLFKKMIVSVYSKRFEEYRDQKLDVRSSRPEGTKDIMVTSYIVSNDDPDVRVDWRVRYKKGRYQVIDVIVEGVSMSITQRSDFSSIIQRGGGNFQVLLDHMKEQLG
jgi:phospholipid transport system substrate-binding protein